MIIVYRQKWVVLFLLFSLRSFKIFVFKLRLWDCFYLFIAALLHVKLLEDKCLVGINLLIPSHSNQGGLLRLRKK